MAHRYGYGTGGSGDDRAPRPLSSPSAWSLIWQAVDLDLRSRRISCCRRRLAVFEALRDRPDLWRVHAVDDARPRRVIGLVAGTVLGAAPRARR